MFISRGCPNQLATGCAEAGTLFVSPKESGAQCRRTADTLGKGQGSGKGSRVTTQVVVGVFWGKTVSIGAPNAVWRHLL